MDLYLIRHTDALPVGTGECMTDADRPLSEDGKSQAKTVATGLQRRGVHLSQILTSPLRRARETAEGIQRQWHGDKPEIVECPHLEPGVRPRKLARFLRTVNAESVALVGHQPDLGAWAAWLIGSKKALIDFGKGGVAHISCSEEPDKGSGILVWLVTLDWLQD
jgi:phosphohistidine phosphatase